MPSSASEQDGEDTEGPASPLVMVRNIGIAAHIDAGKTTTTERILYYTGRTHKMGDVDDGTTATDFDEQEQQRGITIFSAAVSCPWRDHTINLIDTPGHVDFTAEVERCLRVLDGAVVVFDAREGVEPQSETVWRQVRRYRVPAVFFVNKMDKVGADFQMAVESMKRRLDAHPLPVQIPIGAESGFAGLIDLISMRAFYYDSSSLGSRVSESDIPDDMLDLARAARHLVEEKAAETDDAIMHKYLEEQPLGEDEIRRAIRKATVAGTINPVFCGSSLKYVGVQKLLDGVVDYLPSPLDRPPVQGVRSMDDPTPVFRKPSPDEPFSALVFKIVADKPLDLYYLRIYSGVLKSGSRVYNAVTGGKENISRVFRMFAKKREQLSECGPGDIVACLGMKEALTGHTLCDVRDAIVLERIVFPTPVISVSVEPKNTKDRDILTETLEKMVRQDPTFHFGVDKETGQTLISGMGELHLEVITTKLDRDFGVPVNVGRPRVAYREAISRTAEAEGRFERQVGGGRQFAAVRLSVEPMESAGGGESFQFIDAVTRVPLSMEFSNAVQRGVHDSMQQGSLAGYEMLNVRATLLDVEISEIDSTELAFENAARVAFYEAVKNAGPILLEPIMQLQVTTPEDYFGAVAGDISARRGLIQDTESRGRDRIIHAHVPLSTMFQYATALRTLTQGRSSWSMEPLTYSPMPPKQQQEMLKLHGYE